MDLPEANRDEAQGMGKGRDGAGKKGRDKKNCTSLFPCPAASSLEPKNLRKEELRQENVRRTDSPQSREPGVGFSIFPVVFQSCDPV